MIESTYSSAFKKDKKLMEKRHKDLSKLKTVTYLIINEIPLPTEYHEHPLHNNWDGSLECHIEPDWLLVYKFENDDDEKSVYFERTGTHQDIFGW
jgi:mRNA interferase YafQ